ncbi:protein of unknown function [uncultured Sphingopyxis sp.]|uniref:Uncharacterized protein n=1 Tax=uncultured Sphingopyxis sp. TaxID=310581 RepID=A0A1Y5PT99_9SPHN|nr:protein of unknown function [uncultured Sphingopyxis sp.]
MPFSLTAVMPNWAVRRPPRGPFLFKFPSRLREGLGVGLRPTRLRLGSETLASKLASLAAPPASGRGVAR